MQLCELLPRDRAPKRRKLSTSDGDTGLLQRTFSVGAFAIGGGIVGVQHNTYSFPWTTRLLTALVNGIDPRHQYSSCTLLLNVLHYKHQDHSNEPGTMNLLIPCSRWQGGQVWMADSTLLDRCTWTCTRDPVFFGSLSLRALSLTNMWHTPLFRGMLVTGCWWWRITLVVLVASQSGSVAIWSGRASTYVNLDATCLFTADWIACMALALLFLPRLLYS